MSKNNFVKIKMSNTFVFKSRCKYCLSVPKYYFLTRISSNFQDHEIAKFINMWISSNHKRMCQNYYLTEMPKNFTSTSYFGHPVDYKGFNSRFHKNHKAHNLHAQISMVDHLACSCGKTTWSFSEMMSKHRPEVNQRRARFDAPIKFRS